MNSDNRKVVLIGTGLVGMSYAYAMLNRGTCNELALIDVDSVRANGEAMDLNHGLAFAPGAIKIYSSDYDTCADADIVVICAGVSQKPGESRIALLSRNAAIFESIISQTLRSGFDGIFLVATNPVDIMTRITLDISGFDPSRVIGTGTTLDTARLRYLLGEYFSIDPRNVHAYVMGEHGDSEFVPWSQALVATKPVLSVCEEYPDRYSIRDLENIESEVRDAAGKIIAAKRATYYGIGMALQRITASIFGDENSVLTVSAYHNGAYGQDNVYVGSPCIIGRKGATRMIKLSLTDDELERFSRSCSFLKETYRQLKEPAESI